MAVYFARAGEDGPVKIGHARDPKRRLEMLQTGNHRPLRFIRIVEGDRKVEALAHALFSSRRVYGEWFEFSEAMLVFGHETAEAEAATRRPRIKFHPIVEEIILSGKYSRAAVSQWRGHGVPYKVCCRAVAIADERGLPFDVDVEVYRSPIRLDERRVAA